MYVPRRDYKGHDSCVSVGYLLCVMCVCMYLVPVCVCVCVFFVCVCVCMHVRVCVRAHTHSHSSTPCDSHAHINTVVIRDMTHVCRYKRHDAYMSLSKTWLMYVVIRDMTHVCRYKRHDSCMSRLFTSTHSRIHSWRGWRVSNFVQHGIPV
jgi:hypothetical protein